MKGKERGVSVRLIFGQWISMSMSGNQPHNKEEILQLQHLHLLGNNKLTLTCSNGGKKYELCREGRAESECERGQVEHANEYMKEEVLRSSCRLELF